MAAFDGPKVPVDVYGERTRRYSIARSIFELFAAAAQSLMVQLWRHSAARCFRRMAHAKRLAPALGSLRNVCGTCFGRRDLLRRGAISISADSDRDYVCCGRALVDFHDLAWRKARLAAGPH